MIVLFSQGEVLVDRCLALHYEGLDLLLGGLVVVIIGIGFLAWELLGGWLWLHLLLVHHLILLRPLSLLPLRLPLHLNLRLNPRLSLCRLSRRPTLWRDLHSSLFLLLDCLH